MKKEIKKRRGETSEVSKNGTHKGKGKVNCVETKNERGRERDR